MAKALLPALEQLCAVQGLSVGVYSSPYLLQFNERLRINGEDVADNLWCEAFAFIEQLRGDIELTYFEFTHYAGFFLSFETTATGFMPD